MLTSSTNSLHIYLSKISIWGWIMVIFLKNMYRSNAGEHWGYIVAIAVFFLIGTFSTSLVDLLVVPIASYWLYRCLCYWWSVDAEGPSQDS